eukprot:349676-Chlamydomonas_euryale.AAC.8
MPNYRAVAKLPGNCAQDAPRSPSSPLLAAAGRAPRRSLAPLCRGLPPAEQQPRRPPRADFSTRARSTQHAFHFDAARSGRRHRAPPGRPLLSPRAQQRRPAARAARAAATPRRGGPGSDDGDKAATGAAFAAGRRQLRAAAAPHQVRCVVRERKARSHFKAPRRTRQRRRPLTPAARAPAVAVDGGGDRAG